MTRPNEPHRIPVDDLALDGSPDLTAGDQDAIETIRRQLAEEYPGAPDEPGRIPTGPAAPVRRARSRSAWSSPLLATVVMVSGVGGGVVGAMVAVQFLRVPDAELPGAIVASPAAMTAAPEDARTAPIPEPAISGRPSVNPEPSGRTSVNSEPSVSGRPPASVGAVRATPDLPPRADRDATRRLPASRRQLAGAPAPPPAAAPRAPALANGVPRPAPAPAPAPLAAQDAPGTNGVPRPTSPGAGALPAPARLIPAPVPALPPVPADGAPAPARVAATGVPPRVPVPATGVLPAAPVAADGKASAAPEADVAPGSVVSVWLSAGGNTPSGAARTASPVPAPPAAEPPPTSRRRLTLRESLRQDWNAARRGLESAPADLERAWRTFTRDVKGLFDR